MPTDFPLPYLLVLMVIAVLVLYLLHMAQSTAITELSHVLVQQNDPVRYLQMLDSPRLKLVLRPGTLALLRLDGVLAAGDEAAARQLFEQLGTLRLKPAERLNGLQKALDFYVKHNDAAGAEQALAGLEHLLKNEKSSKLQAVLADAQLLVGVYIRQDAACIAPLKELCENQSGPQRGITLYRLAKLYYAGGQGAAAAQALAAARPLVQGTPWQPLVQAAQADPNLLATQ